MPKGTIKAVYLFDESKTMDEDGWNVMRRREKRRRLERGETVA